MGLWDDIKKFATIAGGAMLGGGLGMAGGMGSTGAMGGAVLPYIGSPSKKTGTSPDRDILRKTNPAPSSGGGEYKALIKASAPKGGESLADQLRSVANMTKEFLPQYQELLFGQSSKYLPQYLSLYDQLRQSDLGNILRSAEGFQPRLDALQRKVEGPALSEMRDLASQQVLEELRAGQSLSPAMRRATEQNVRASEIARGLGAGGGSANREAVQKSMEGYNLWKDRLGLSQNVRNFEQGMRYDPLNYVAKTPTQIPYAQGAFDQGVNLTSSALGGAMQMKSLRDQLAQNQSQFNANMAWQNKMYEAQQAYMPILQQILAKNS